MGWKADKVGLDQNKVCGAQYGGPIAIITESLDTTLPSSMPKSNPTSKVAIDTPWVQDHSNQTKPPVPNDSENTTNTTSLSSSQSTPMLTMYTSAGHKISESAWTHQSVAGLGWGDLEQLYVVLHDGTVLIFDIKCSLVRQFTLYSPSDFPTPGKGAQASFHVLEVHLWGNGLVALGADFQAYVAEGLASIDSSLVPRRYKLRTTLTAERPHTAMTIVPPILSRSGLLEIIFGTIDNSALVVDENDVEDQLLQDRIAAPIVKVALQPNGRYLACYRRDGVLTVLSSNFVTKVLDFNTKSISRPLDMAWCGEDAVVLLWRNTGVVMVGPFGDWLNFPYTGIGGGVRLVAEPDCVRILTTSHCDIIQRIPQSTEAIRRIGSTDPAALMYDAMEAFEEGDPKSDENIRSIAASNTLHDAVSACIAAAAGEFDVGKQQAYLKAASYGKAFSSDIDPAEFVETAKKLRVLNEVRKASVGMPMTMQQYTLLTPETLVARLTARDLHLLAMKISALLGLREEKILVHWACEKVRRLAATPAGDEEIAASIRRRLEATRASYLEIAAAAYHTGRRHLATMILDLEQHAADQVPLLLSMQEDEVALQKAVNSEDTDLVYLVLIHLERSRPDMENFFRLTNNHPEASNLLKQYYRNKQDTALLDKLLAYNKHYLEGGISLVSQAYHAAKVSSTSSSTTSTSSNQDGHTTRIRLMRDAAALFAQDRTLGFLRVATEEQVDLFETLRALAIRLGGTSASPSRSYDGLTLSETLQHIINMSVDQPQDGLFWEREFGRIAKKFKASDKMLYHIKINTYAKRQQWGVLAQLAQSGKSPVGYVPFAAAALRHKQPASEVERYVDKCSSAEEKYGLYMEIQAYRKAFECAKALKDEGRLAEVLAQCRDAALEKSCREALTRL